MRTFTRIFTIICLSVCTHLATNHLHAQCSPVTANPNLPTSTCPIKVVLVLDESGSMGFNNNAGANALRNAVTGFLNSLNGTNSEAAIVEFSSSATRVSINGSTGLQIIDNSFNNCVNNFYLPPTSNSCTPHGYNPGGGTNWAAAFTAANAIAQADLVMMITDGNPTSGQTGCSQANTLKSSGKHLFMIGLGSNVNNTNLQAVSGPDQYTPGGSVSFAEADWTSVPNVNDLTLAFGNFARELCQFAVDCNIESNVTCLASTDGAVSVDATVNFPPAMYAWYEVSAPANILSTTNTLSNVGVGTYEVLIVDQLGYSNSCQVELTAPSNPVADALTATTCSDVASGLILTNSGTTPATSYNILFIATNGLTASAGNPETGTGYSANVIADDAYTNTTGAPVEVVYTIVPVSADGCEGDWVDVVLTINPEPVLASDLNTTACSDVASGMVLSTTGLVAQSYTITQINMNGLSPSAGNPATGIGLAANVLADDAYTNTTGAPVDVVYTVVPVSAAGCSGDPVAVTFTVDPEPVLSGGLDATTCSEVAGGMVLSTTGLAAESYTISQINMNGLTPSGGNPATGTDLAANVLADDAYTNTTGAPVDVVYTVIPLSFGGCTGDPVEVTLTIDPEPQLAGNLDATVCSDVASGIVLGTTGLAAQSYTITQINTNGLTASAGNPVTGSGFSANEIADDAYTNTTGVPVDVNYTIVPVSADGCAGNPVNVTLTVDPEPVLATDLSTTACSDIASGIVLNTSGLAAQSYTITQINMNGLTPSAGNPATGSGLAANVLADDAYTNTTGAPVNVVYTVVPVSAAGCAGDAVAVTFTVDPEPVLSGGLDATTCSEVAGGIVLSTSGLAAESYTITQINMNGLVPSGGNPATGTDLPASVLADDSYTNTTGAPVNVVYTLIPVSFGGCAGDPVEVTLTIEPEPILTTDLDAIVCSDIASGIVLSTTGLAAQSYTITQINMNGLTASAGNPVTGNGFNANEIADDTYTNTTGAPVDVTYTIVPVSADGCAGDPVNVTLTVNPEPVLAADLNATACSDVASGIILNTTGLVAQSYTITQINMNGLVPSAGNPATGSGLTANVLADDAYTNTTGAPVDVVYTVVPVSAAGCAGDAVAVTFTVDPEPVLSGGLDATTCSEVAGGIVLSTSGLAAESYTISQINMNGLVPSGGNPATGPDLPASVLADDAYTNSTGAPVDVVYTVIPVSFGGCAGDPVEVTLTIDPEPILSGDLNTTVCSDIASGIVLSTTGLAAQSYTITQINMNGLSASAGNPVTGSGFNANEIVDDAYTNTSGAAVNVVYTIVPVSADGCQGDAIDVALTITPEPIMADNLDVARCSDVPSGIILSTMGGTIASGYDIIYIDMKGLIPSGGNPAIGSNLPASVISDDAYTNTTNSAVEVVYTVVPVAGTSCTGDAVEITFTVNPEPVLAAGLEMTACSDEPANIVLSTSGGTDASGYHITQINMNGLIPSAGNPTTGTNLPANEIFDDAFTNTSTASVDVIYTIVPVAANGCEGDPVEVAFTVDPEPVMANSLDATVCSNDPSGIQLSTIGLSAQSYNILSIAMNGLTPSAGNPVTGNGLSASELADDAYVNTSGTAIDVVYSVQPVSTDGCSGDAIDIVLTVTPEPVLANNLDATICSDSPSGVILAAGGGTAASSYNITNINMNGLVPSAGSPATGLDLPATEISDDAYTNLTGVAVDVVYTIVPVAGSSCVGEPAEVRLTIAPEPSVSDLMVLSCFGETLNVALMDGILARDRSLVDGFTYTAVSSDPGVIAAPAPRTVVSADPVVETFENSSGADVVLTYTVQPVLVAAPQGTSCMGDPFTLSVTVSSEISCNATTNDVTCNGLSDGSISLNPLGGSGNYDFAWSHLANHNAPIVSGLSAGNYQVTITDDRMCTTICDIVVSEPPVLSAGISFACNGDGTADMDLEVVGGSEPYTYLWNTGGTVEDPQGVSQEAWYSVMVTDAQNCQIEASIFPAGCCRLELSACPNPNLVSCLDDTTTVTEDILTLEQLVVMDPGPCGPIDIELIDRQTSGDCGQSPGYEIIRTYSISDGVSTVFCTRSNLVFDDQAPVPPAAPASMIVSCSAIPDPVDPGTATDNCTSIIQPVFSETGAPLGECQSYEIVRTWTYTDICGNSSAIQQVLTVVDDQPPVPISVPNALTVQCPDDVPAPVNLQATDACMSSPLEVAPVDQLIPLSGPRHYQIQRSWTFADVCGNDTTVSQMIEVRDTENPVIAMPAMPAFECIDEVPPPMASMDAMLQDGGFLSDNCAIDPSTFALASEQTSGNCPMTLVRNYTVADSSGNITTTPQIIEIWDHTPPAFQQYPENQNMGCILSEPAISDLPAPILDPLAFGAMDNCTGPSGIQVVYEDSGPEIDGCLYVFERTYSLVDGCGNQAFAPPIEIVFTFDNEAPEFVNVPENLVFDCDADIPAVFTGVSAIDNCNGPVNITFVELEGQLGCLGESYTRTWTAVDACGNTAEASQIVWRADLSAPEITRGADTTIQCGEPIPEARFEISDNCTRFDESYQVDTLPGTCSFEYTIRRMWHARNRCGEEVRDTQFIHVVDTIGPTIEIVNPMLQGMAYGGVMEMYDCGVPGLQQTDFRASDCSGLVSEVAYDSLLSFNSCNVFGYYQKWVCGYRAEDACGNVSEFKFYVHQYDTLAPVWIIDSTFNDTIHLECNDEIPAIPQVRAEDNCTESVNISFLEDTLGNYPEDFVLLRFWEGVDACGNLSTLRQVIEGCNSTILAQMGSISGFVWLDEDLDGVRDELEPGVNGQIVRLYRDSDGDGQPDPDFSRTAATGVIDGQAGRFHFDAVSAGIYQLAFAVNQEYGFTAVHMGESPDQDSDVFPGTGMTSIFTIGAGEHLSNLNAGLNTQRQQPLEITSFGIHQQSCLNHLTWESIGGHGGEQFEIQRSANGRDFKTLGIVKAHQKDIEFASYQFRDAEQLIGIYQYRIKQINADGSEVYSELLSMKNACNQHFQWLVFPNPVREELQIDLELHISEDVTLRLFNQLGQEVGKWRIQALRGGHLLRASLDHLPAGLYWLSAQAGNVQRQLPVVKVD